MRMTIHNLIFINFVTSNFILKSLLFFNLYYFFIDYKETLLTHHILKYEVSYNFFHLFPQFLILSQCDLYLLYIMGNILSFI